MKSLNRLICLAVLFCGLNALANNPKDTLYTKVKNESSKSFFYDAKNELEDMLSGKIPLDYERAVFITENAYWDNDLSYDKFQRQLDIQTSIIEKLANAYDKSDTMKFKSIWFETAQDKKAKYKKNLKNAAIFNFITDTVYYVSQSKVKIHFPFKYPYSDPNGSISWSNTQVMNLLSPNAAKGNCYAMTALYKIFAERLKVEANITTASGHIFIEHKDQTGHSYNVELATASFPGNGSIETLTYTSDRALKSGISMRTLDLKQSIGLCLVYLAKGYEHKFHTTDDSFMMNCAELSIKHDSLNLNALLLKSEIMESRIINSMEIMNAKNLKQASLDISFKKQLLEYEKVVTFLFDKGYKEMPMEMKNIILSKLNNDDNVVIGQDHTPQPFSSIGVKTNRYATLSNGLFDEMILDKPIEKISRTEFDTKRKKIISFTAYESTYNKYSFDPVVFAWCIDPMTHVRPSWNPYNFCRNNPILNTDPTGALDDKYTVDVSGDLIDIEVDDKPNTLFVQGGDGTKKEIPLNDPSFDSERLKQFQVGDHLVDFISYGDVNAMKSDANINEGKENPKSFAWDESHGGRMDFTWNYLLPATGFKQDKDAADKFGGFIAFQGLNKAYNIPDAGNFLWGNTAKEMGIGLGLAKLGAHGFAVMNGYLGGDSKGDQSAITQGYYYNSGTSQTNKTSFLDNVLPIFKIDK